MDKFIKKHIWTSFLFFFLLGLVPYVYVFHSVGISRDPQNWSAFATYIGMVISGISIYLLYITYQSQIRANEISLFEKRFYSACATIQNLESKNSSHLKQAFDAIAYHFITGYYSEMEKLKQEQCKSILSYYYSHAVTDADSLDFEQMFTYVLHTFHYICRVEAVTDRKEFVLELFSQMKTETRVLLFCYVLRNGENELFEEMNRYNCFSFNSQELSNSLLLVFISKAATDTYMTATATQKKVAIEEIECEEYSKEQLFDTVERLFPQR